MQKYNLPWNQSECYWLGLWGDDALPVAFTEPLRRLGLQQEGNAWFHRMPQQWDTTWNEVRHIIREKGPAVGLHLALFACDDKPTAAELKSQEKPITIIDGIASNLWLGKALEEDRFVSFMQKVVDKRGKVFGYEAFGRGMDVDGKIIDGASIFRASKGLQIEHILDRHLHVRSIETFLKGDLNGFLFINMLPGFIHRPERYLQGLSDAVASHQLPPNAIVIDITHASSAQEPRHLKAIHDYCTLQGYATALDDITSLEVARMMLNNMRPAFLKLDIKLSQQVETPARLSEIRQIVELGREHGSTVIAEGVETARQHELLEQTGVELFQGYYFGRPEAVETA